jgi:hypothetical protein
VLDLSDQHHSGFVLIYEQFNPNAALELLAVPDVAPTNLSNPVTMLRIASAWAVSCSLAEALSSAPEAVRCVTASIRDMALAI